MEFTLEQALQKGVEAHKAGNVYEADRYYTAILNAQPKHPDANHNMGILAVGFGNTEAALPFFKTALEISPKIEQFWLSYIDALIKLDRIDNAKAVLDQAKSRCKKGNGFEQIEKMLGSSSYKNSNAQEPSQKELKKLLQLYDQNRLLQVFAEAQKLTKKYTQSLTLWNLMGVSAAQIGKREDAILAFQKAISIKPDYAEAYNNMGATLKDQGKLDEAIQAYNKAISIKPDYAEANYNVGVTLKEQGKLDEAIQAYIKAISIKPDYAEANYNVGVTLKEQGKLDEAIQAYKKALSIKPDYAEAYNDMGVTLHDQSKLEEAIEAYKKALSIKPDYAEAHNNMGVTLQDQSKLEEAIAAYKKALSIKPDYAEAYNNMGNAFKEQGKLEEAIEVFNKAVLVKPNFAEAYNSLAFLKLMTDDWKDGIKLLEWRWKTGRMQNYKRVFKAPQWDGNSTLEGKTLLVWGEQGPGDMIIWSACLNYYTKTGATVIVECSQKLVKLFTMSFPKITVRVENKEAKDEKEDFDFQIPLKTLFGYACLSGKISSDQGTYIFPDRARVDYWKNRLKIVTEKPCIGISWKSPVMNIRRQNNYADLSFWKPILQNENYTFFNLQSSDFEGDLQRISQDFGVEVINFEEIDHYNDLAEVAAFCKALDKTISIATTVAHISTAVGTPTIIPTWRQGPWNNILFSSRGPKIKFVYRNTWDSWKWVFSDVKEMLA